MATVPQVIRHSRRPAVLWAAALLALASGCITISVNQDAPDPTKPNGPIKAVARWDSEVRFAPDTTRGGTLTPGIVGRVYLFGQRPDFPIEGDGAIHVEVADASQSPPKTLEQWDLDAETVRKHLRKDAVGMGYSLFLPWATFRPDLKCVELKLGFHLKQGGVLFATPARVVFDHSGMPSEPKVQLPPVPAAIQSAAMPRATLPPPRPVEMPRR